jgi:hypothetical protein
MAAGCVNSVSGNRGAPGWPADRDSDWNCDSDRERNSDRIIHVEIPVAVVVPLAVAVPVADAFRMAADIAFGIGVEAGEIFHPLVHGEGRARHRWLEIVRRFGIEADRSEVERLARENLAGAFAEQHVDRPFGVAEARVEVAPVLRHRL